MAAAVGIDHRQRLLVLDHMVIRDDIAVLTDDHSRAAGALRLLRLLLIRLWLLRKRERQRNALKFVRLRPRIEGVDHRYDRW